MLPVGCRIQNPTGTRTKWSSLVQRQRRNSFWFITNDAYLSEPKDNHQRTLSARRLLRLGPTFTKKELRTSYFMAAKQSHPDHVRSRISAFSRISDPSPTTTTTPSSNEHLLEQDAGEQFRLVTDAYELLSEWLIRKDDANAKQIHGHDDDDDDISWSEQEEYRQACRDWLGQSAEIVEESKACPAFRQWLRGRTDAAQHWQLFFMLHGGLAPKLPRTRPRLPNLVLSANGHQMENPPEPTRRRRPGR
jgi:hypothetical protein